MSGRCNEQFGIDDSIARAIESRNRRAEALSRRPSHRRCNNRRAWAIDPMDSCTAGLETVCRETMPERDSLPAGGYRPFGPRDVPRKLSRQRGRQRNARLAEFTLHLEPGVELCEAQLKRRHDGRGENGDPIPNDNLAPVDEESAEPLAIHSQARAVRCREHGGRKIRAPAAPASALTPRRRPRRPNGSRTPPPPRDGYRADACAGGI